MDDREEIDDIEETDDVEESEGLAGEDDGEAGGKRKKKRRDKPDVAEVRKAVQAAYDAQNLPVGIVAGVAVALIGAGVWAGITAATGYQIGYMALAVGAGVGFAIQKLGKGVTPVFGYAGAGLALAGCLLGNALAVAFLAAAIPELAEQGVVWSDILFSSALIDLMVETSSPIDLLFYGIAAYEGYQFAFTKLPHPSQIR